MILAKQPIRSFPLHCACFRGCTICVDTLHYLCSEENDLHLRTLEVAQIREDEYFGSLIADDLKGILRDIRSEHRPDTMTADEVSFAENIQN